MWGVLSTSPPPTGIGLRNLLPTKIRIRHGYHCLLPDVILTVGTGEVFGRGARVVLSLGHLKTLPAIMAHQRVIGSWSKIRYIIAFIIMTFE